MAVIRLLYVLMLKLGLIMVFYFLNVEAGKVFYFKIEFSISKLNFL